MKYVVRAGLAVAMLVGFYLLAVGLAFALVLGVTELLERAAGLSAGPEAALLAGPVVLAIAYGVFFRTREGPPHGMVLSEEDQPRLWALAREVAALGSTRDVDEIRLAPEVNASVSDSSTWLGLRRGTRRMFVGAPLLVALDESQVRAVLAHEFGHYSGRHTTLVRITYRGAESIRRILSQLGRRNPVALLLRFYGQLYFAISRSVNRRQELEADQLGVQVAGAGAMASALLEIRPTAGAWDWYCHLFADLGVASGRRPEHLLTGFADFLDTPEVSARLEEVRETADDEKPSVYDTHPSTAVRVRALDAPSAPVRERGERATALLDGPDQAFAAFERELYGTELTPTPLAELVPLAADDAARRHARVVDDLLQSRGRPPGLRTVMQYLGNGMSRELVRHALPADLDPDGVTAATAAVLGGYLAAALLEGGQVEHRLDWPRGWVLVDRSGVDLDLSGLVTEVMETPSRAAELDELLRLTGASASFRAEDHRPSGPRLPDPETSQVLGVVTAVNKARTLVVHDDGLLLVSESAWRRVLAGAAPATVSALLSTRRAHLVPWERIERLRRIQLSGGRERIICEVAGGGTLDLKIGPRSGRGGAPYAALRDALGERYRAEERIGTRI
jgi:Zn-dependent protease with chaperone function